MAWDDNATHPVSGAIVPRCQARPGAPDIEGRPELGRHVWECGLPAGHEDWPDTMTVERDDGAGGTVTDVYDLTRHRRHSWSNTGEA